MPERKEPDKLKASFFCPETETYAALYSKGGAKTVTRAYYLVGCAKMETHASYLIGARKQQVRYILSKCAKVVSRAALLLENKL
ncbi:hypothetical protein RCO48_09190 [Peribacillus frigoritolerans]|nr:hypothetical protein [Peribacillus frigoritolerans]